MIALLVSLLIGTPSASAATKINLNEALYTFLPGKPVVTRENGRLVYKKQGAIRCVYTGMAMPSRNMPPEYRCTGGGDRSTVGDAAKEFMTALPVEQQMVVGNGRFQLVKQAFAVCASTEATAPGGSLSKFYQCVVTPI
jgi:hypothetical protein